jgi:hypothetical protein
MNNEEKNCSTCMYSEYSDTNIFINDLTKNDYATCIHINSPYYMCNVNTNYYCRLHVDSIKYFKNKDRKDKLDNLNNL